MSLNSRGAPPSPRVSTGPATWNSGRISWRDLLPGIPEGSAGGTCYLEFRKDQLAFLLPVQLEMAAVLFGVPLLITSYCCSRPVCILGKGASQRRRKRVVGSQQPCCSTFSSALGPTTCPMLWATPRVKARSGEFRAAPQHPELLCRHPLLFLIIWVPS